MVVNRDIVEGLRNALSRGYTLEQAMISFHNAGYKKEDVEEAAQALHEHPSHPLSHPGKKISKEAEKPVTKPFPPEYHPKPQAKPPIIKKTKEPEETKPKEPDKQLISKYEEKTKPKGRLTLILILIALIIILLGVFAIFIF